MSIKNDGHYFCRAGGNRPDGLNEPVTFKWLRLWLIKGRISRRLPVRNSSGIGVELLPVEMTLDERPYPAFYARLL
ncbi:IS66 family insertion sequence element accessory protein TnpB [Escherichia coli]